MVHIMINVINRYDDMVKKIEHFNDTVEHFDSSNNGLLILIIFITIIYVLYKMSIKWKYL